MMTTGERITVAALIAVSVALFAFAVGWLIHRIFRNKRMPERYNKAGINTALVFSALLALSILFFRFAFGYFSILMPEPDAKPLHVIEEFFSSLFLTLRTFSIDETYGELVLTVKRFVEELFLEGRWYFYVSKILLISYATVLDILAPVMGGAIILELFASVFPKIMLRLAYLNTGRPKYYFSELNDASLTLAKSIYYEEKAAKPYLIFTDTYVDNEKEKEYELWLEAKKYGAICVRDDLAHVVKPKKGKQTFYLMDENEFGNLETLMGLICDHSVEYIKSSCIYLFVKSDAYVQVEKQINERLDKQEKKGLLGKGEKPLIIPVNAYRNLVQNLLCDVPLYEPLVPVSGDSISGSELKVTILGNGNIGTEAFLNVYWFGQMLISRNNNGIPTMTPCNMTINVVSQDTEDAFWSKINYINSEIRETVTVIGKESECNGGVLKYNGRGQTNDPYCKVRYVKADVKVGGFWDNHENSIQEILRSDYFIVALGCDADNISVAQKLRFSIGKRHLEASGELNNTVIAYAVFDSDLVEALNEQKRYRSRYADKADIYMHAFGSLERVYSCDNIYMSRSKLLANETENAYLKMHVKATHISENRNRSKNEDKNYTYWSNLARAMHLKYKVFSLGWISSENESVFKYAKDTVEEDSADALHKNKIDKICLGYKKASITDTWNNGSERDKALRADLELKKHCLAWLEHRRWNAFTRTMGYRYTDKIRENFSLNGNNHKNMKLKLHPCLTEAKFPEIEKGEVYIQQDGLMARVFEDFGKEYGEIGEKLCIEDRLRFLNKKERYFQRISKLLCDGSSERDSLDMLDSLSFDWREIAVAANLERIAIEAQYLNDLNEKGIAVANGICNEYEKVKYIEVGSYNFKKYDYPACELDDYLSVTKLASLLERENADALIRDCSSGKFNGAICFDEKSREENGEPGDWYIPIESVRDQLNERYFDLDISEEKHRSLIESRSESIFFLCGTWYVAKKSEAYRALQAENK
ncbi:MAG: hypothetical protein IJA52_07290 [Clostridia bacterium]|nr:hypothetical protein [Clostridia bacterium]